MGNGAYALPQVAEKTVKVLAEREADADEGTDSTARNDVDAETGQRDAESFGHTADEFLTAFPTEGDGNADQDEEADNVRQFLDDNRTQGTHGYLGILTADEKGPGDFTETWRNGIDEIGYKNEFDGPADGDANIGGMKQHTPPQSPEYIGTNTGQEGQDNPEIIGTADKDFGQ